MLAQDPAAADPVCDKSPRHDVVAAIVDQAQQQRSIVEAKPLLFRDPKNSKALSGLGTSALP